MLNVERIVRVLSGTVILVSLALGVKQSPFFVSSYILWVTVFVGASLLQSGITKFCLLEVILKKTGVCKE